MERRELLKMIAVLTGSAVIGGEFFLSGCSNNSAGSTISFSPETIALLDEIAETIIPTTDSPGAKAAKVGEFMKSTVSDCYSEANQQAFTSGIGSINDVCKKATGKTFLESDVKQRRDFLVTLEKEAKEFNTKVDEENKKAKDAIPEAEFQKKLDFQSKPRHYYTMLKQMTLMGYFTSEIGATKALRHIPVPGKYDGAMPYKKGDKAWA